LREYRVEFRVKVRLSLNNIRIGLGAIGRKGQKLRLVGRIV
jgi:hypothetical protein